MSFPIHVYPELRVKIVRQGRVASAQVTGGDGGALAYTWSLPRGRAAYTSSVNAARSAALRVTVSELPAASPPRPPGQITAERALPATVPARAPPER